jgi:hypothetical protein
VAATAAVIADEAPPVSYPAPALLQWYQFEGSLRNSLSALTDEQTLVPAKETPTRWAAAGQSYGLAIGPDDPYLLSPVNFFRTEKDQGGGILLFHIRPLSEGIIFSAFFPLRASLTDGVWMSMIKDENVIALRLSAAGTFVDLPVYLTFSAAEGLIPIAVEFYIRPNRLEAKISLDENLQNKAGAVKLPGALSGEGRIRLGDAIDKSLLNKFVLEKPVIKNEAETEYQDYQTIPDSAEELNAYIPAVVETFPDTIWDELAILFSAIPLLPEESLEPVVEEENAVQQETAADAIPVAGTAPAKPDDADSASAADVTPTTADAADTVSAADTAPVIDTISATDITPAADTTPTDTMFAADTIPAADAMTADTPSTDISIEAGLPLTDTDVDNPVQEQETQERKVSENL